MRSQTGTQGDSMHPYVASLKTLFEHNANPAQAGPMKKYMRDHLIGF